MFLFGRLFKLTGRKVVTLFTFFVVIMLTFEQVAFSMSSLPPEKNTNRQNFVNQPPQRNSPGLKKRDLINSWQAYKLPEKIKNISSTAQLPVMANGESGLVSNATNFHGQWKSEVNPRTGNVSFSMTTDSILYDTGQGKWNLMLSYTGGMSKGGPDSFGLGPHWSWNVGKEVASPTEIDGHQTTEVILGDGHALTMESTRNADGRTIWLPARHKLHDILVTGEPGNWTVSTSTGTREHIFQGYENWQEDQGGKRLYFYYDRQGYSDSTRQLTYICPHQLTLAEQQKQNFNACPTGIWISYNGDQITVHGHQRIVLDKNTDHGIDNIVAVHVPALTSQTISGTHGESDQINFYYDNDGHRPWLMHKIQYPTGLQDTFLYNSESDHPGASSQGLPTGRQNGYIPVVTEHVLETGIPGQAQHIYYRYASEENRHNYLGYQEMSSLEPGKDNLFDRPSNYTYSTTEDNGLTSTTTVFNKYHLPVMVTQVDNEKKTTLVKNEKNYPDWQETVFDKLPANYSFPTDDHTFVYELHGKNSAVKPTRIEKKIKYDSNGQPIWQQDAYGRITMTQYCPEEGDRHCPPADADWPLIPRIEKTIKLPAVSEKHNELIQSASSDNTLQYAEETVFDYQKMPLPESNSSTQGFLWQVKSKYEGSVPLTEFTHANKNDNLPEISEKNLKTKISFTYDKHSKNIFYGRLNKVVTTKLKQPPPVVFKNNRMLSWKNFYRDDNKDDSIVLDIKNSLSSGNNVRTMTVGIEKEYSPYTYTLTNKKDNFDITGNNSEINDDLGISKYSTVTGLKISRSDVLNQQSIKWNYDIWGRPVEEIVTHEDDQTMQIKKWDYIINSQENSIIITDHDQQNKVMYDAEGKIIASMHRFKDCINKPANGTENWIPDTRDSWTPSGRLTSRTTWHESDPDDNGHTHLIALTTTYGYDILGRVIWVRHPDNLVSITVRNDPAMELVKYHIFNDPESGKTEFGPLLLVQKANVLGSVTASYTLPLDPDVMRNGKPVYSIALQQQLAAIKPLLTSNHLYTASGKLSYFSTEAGNSGALLQFVKNALESGHWLTHSLRLYDGFNRLIKQVADDGAITRWQYDRDHLVAVTGPDGRIVHDTYNVLGKKISRCVTPDDSTVCHVLGNREYDKSGQLKWEEDEYGARIYYDYDKNGRLIKKVTPKEKDAPGGHVFTYHYSSMGITEKSVDGHPYVKYFYDPETWKLSDMEDAVEHVHYHYSDNSGNLVKITHSAPGDNTDIIPNNNIHYPEYEELFTQDSYNTPVSMVDGAGNRYTALHDHFGQIIKEQVQLAGSSAKQTLAIKSYDHFGRTLSIKNGIGILRAFSYDSLGRLNTVEDALDGHTFDRFSYTYDAETGNLTSLTQAEGAESATSTYRYDLLNNLTEMTCTKTDDKSHASSLCPRDIELKNSGLTVPPIIMRQSYTFDRWNNIKTVSEDVVSENKHLTKTTHYSYRDSSTDGNKNYDPNQLLSYQTIWSGQSYTPSPELISYDNEGRIIKDSDGNLLHYNAFGQQDRFINGQTAEITRYVYNSSGRQIAEQPFSSSDTPLQPPLYFFYRGTGLSGEAQKDSHGHLRITTELNGLAKSIDGHITTWYVHDYKGDVIKLFNNDKELISSRVYSPYGMQYNLHDSSVQALPQKLFLKSQSDWLMQNTLGFNAERTDPATGYQFLGGGYRAYNPIYRRFMAKDSYSPFERIDGYGFGSNNPIMNTDPSGHQPKWVSYLTASLTIPIAITSAILVPWAVSIASGAVAVKTIIMTTIEAGLGVAGAGLQIAATAHSEVKGLAIAEQAVGVCQGVLGSIPMTAWSALALYSDSAFRGLGNFRKLVKALMITSTSSATVAWSMAGVATTLSFASDVKQKIKDNKGVQTAIKVFNGLFVGIAAGSLITSLFTAPLTLAAPTVIEERYYAIKSQARSEQADSMTIESVDEEFASFIGREKKRGRPVFEESENKLKSPMEEDDTSILKRNVSNESNGSNESGYSGSQSDAADSGSSASTFSAGYDRFLQIIKSDKANTVSLYRFSNVTNPAIILATALGVSTGTMYFSLPEEKKTDGEKPKQNQENL